MTASRNFGLVRRHLDYTSQPGTAGSIHVYTVTWLAAAPGMHTLSRNEFIMLSWQGGGGHTGIAPLRIKSWQQQLIRPSGQTFIITHHHIHHISLPIIGLVELLYCSVCRLHGTRNLRLISGYRYGAVHRTLCM